MPRFPEGRRATHAAKRPSPRRRTRRLVLEGHVQARGVARDIYFITGHWNPPPYITLHAGGGSQLGGIWNVSVPVTVPQALKLLLPRDLDIKADY